MSMAVDGYGHWVAVWDSLDDLLGFGTEHDILVARSTDDGLTWTHPKLINQTATIDVARDQRPHVTTDRTGNWMVVWELVPDPRVFADTEIVLARSTNNGASWGSISLLDPDAFSRISSDRWSRKLVGYISTL
jgi:hypothetical protein